MSDELLEITAVASDKVEDAVIKGVRILGEHSVNKRHYPKDLLRRVPEAFVGRQVWVNHDKQSPTRKAEDRFGAIENVHFDEEQAALYGDLRYIPEHPMAERVLGDLKRKTGFFQLSINAVGPTKLREDGIKEVLDIVDVRSVDLVSGGATNKSLTEQAETPAEEHAEKQEESAIALDLAEDLVEEALLAAIRAAIKDPATDAATKATKCAALVKEFLKLDCEDCNEQAEHPSVKELEELREQVSALTARNVLLQKYQRPVSGEPSDPTKVMELAEAAEETLDDKYAKWRR